MYSDIAWTTLKSGIGKIQVWMMPVAVIIYANRLFP